MVVMLLHLRCALESIIPLIVTTSQEIISDFTNFLHISSQASVSKFSASL